MTKSILEEQHQLEIKRLVESMVLCGGIGTMESACSIAAINLALTGELTDSIPDCMSELIGNWIINIQDAMPHEMRNSPKWKSLLPFAAGTGRQHEEQRAQLLIDWMWNTCLSELQPVADAYDFGSLWQEMLQKKTFEKLEQMRDYVIAHKNLVAARNYVENSMCFDSEYAAVKYHVLSAVISALKNANVAFWDLTGMHLTAVSDVSTVAAASIDAINRLHNSNLQTVSLYEVSAYFYDFPDDYQLWEKFDPCGMLEKLIDVS